MEVKKRKWEVHLDSKEEGKQEGDNIRGIHKKKEEKENERHYRITGLFIQNPGFRGWRRRWWSRGV